MTTIALLPDPATPLSRETAAAAFADILDARASASTPTIRPVAISTCGWNSTSISPAAMAW